MDHQNEYIYETSGKIEFHHCSTKSFDCEKLVFKILKWYSKLPSIREFYLYNAVEGNDL